MSSERYTCGLSAEILQKSHRELLEPLNNDERLSYIVILEYLHLFILYVIKYFKKLSHAKIAELVMNYVLFHNVLFKIEIHL